MQKERSIEFLEFNPSEHEDDEASATTPDPEDPVGTTIATMERWALVQVPPELAASFRRKMHTLDDQSSFMWELVPKPFIALISSCFAFTLVALTALAFMAATPHSEEGSRASEGEPDAPTSSSLLLCIGVMTSIFGSLQTASGYCAQRLSHQLDTLLANHDYEKNKDSSKRTVEGDGILTVSISHQPTASGRTERKRSPLFLIGILLLVCGTLAAIVNLGILGQSVTAPFAAMTLIFNGCLAFAVLHEAITNYDIIATVLVLFGVAVAMLGVGMADMGVQTFVLADLEAMFSRSIFPTFYSIAVLGALSACYLFVTHRGLEDQPAGLCCFSIGAGLLSGFSSLCVKCTVEVLKSATQRHSSDLANPVSYLFVLGIPVCVLSQLKLMTMGLQFFGTLKFVPPYHAFIILSNLVNGMVYFDESRAYGPLSAVLFVIGCAITIMGVFVLLAKAPSTSTATVSDDESDGEVASIAPMAPGTLVLDKGVHSTQDTTYAV